MDVKVKGLIAIAPFGIAIAVGTSLAMPAYTEFSDKSAQADERKVQQEELQTKLAGKAKIQREKKDIEDLIEKLRANVPKKPELELMNIDVEKMCDESDVDLISFGTPTKDDLQKAGVDDKMLEEAQKAKDKLKQGLKAAATAASGGGIQTAPTPPPKPGEKKEESPDAGLLKSWVQVKIIGDYAGIQKLCKKLETYQRTVNITQMKASVPKREKTIDMKNPKHELPDEAPLTEAEEQGDHRRLNATLLITAYYLP